jgi:Leucine-rich repeat (LRR) protein
MSLTTLQGLNQLSCLMELYIGNNNICEMREVQQLRDLPKLIILDLLGNPLCQSLDYRLYVVYHLRKLKVQTVVYACDGHITYLLTYLRT